jgi:hypothetical protein
VYSTALPPGPIFYYGGLYGEIRTHTKCNTTLVTCDRFSTSSAAPPKEFGVRRFRSFIFGLTCIGGGFYPGSFENSRTRQKPPLVPTQGSSCIKPQQKFYEKSVKSKPHQWVLKRYGGTIQTGPPVATQKPRIENKRQFSSNSPMRFLVTPRACVHAQQQAC